MVFSVNNICIGITTHSRFPYGMLNIFSVTVNVTRLRKRIIGFQEFMNKIDYILWKSDRGLPFIRSFLLSYLVANDRELTRSGIPEQFLAKHSQLVTLQKNNFSTSRVRECKIGEVNITKEEFCGFWNDFNAWFQIADDDRRRWWNFLV